MEYNVCKCGKNPAINENEFDMTIMEYGMKDKILREEITAICKTCHEKFKFEEKYY
jgi:hypothetical protein